MDFVNDDPSGFIAWAKAGLDKNFTLFKVYTRPLTNKQEESGQFDFACTLDLAAFESYADPVGLLKRAVRAYVNHGIASTGVPVEKWIVEFSPVMERYNIPSHLFLDTARDRSWLA